MLNNSDMVEAKSGEIKVPDISPTTMESLLFFIYHDNIFALYKFCVYYFKNNLTEENAEDVMKLAYLKNEHELLRKLANLS